MQVVDTVGVVAMAVRDQHQLNFTLGQRFQMSGKLVLDQSTPPGYRGSTQKFSGRRAIGVSPIQRHFRRVIGLQQSDTRSNQVERKDDP